MERISADDARTSLDAIDHSRSGVADRLVTPWWYYAVIGLGLAQMVVVYGYAADTAWPAVSSVLCALVCGGLIKHYAERTGALARFPRDGRSRLVFALFLVGITAPVVWVIAVSDPATWAVWLAAGIVFVAAAGVGPVYDAAYRAAVRRGVA